MIRYLLFLPELLVFGLDFATFKFLARSPKPIHPQKAWQLFKKSSGFIKWFEYHYPPKIVIRLLRLYYRNTFAFKNHSYGIVKHYDISNDFYKLFLDKKYMFYSCADFVKVGDSLEKAQDNKANYLIKLIDPKPREKILDLGCGWGGMLRKIYEVTDDKENLVGYTLSSEQKKYIDKNFGFRVEMRDFITSEYEAQDFDKICSIEALEHVRGRELLPLFQKLNKALKPNGKIILQFACQVNDVPPPVLLSGIWDIFPGTELTSLKIHLEVFDKANLRVTHLSIHDYRPTLEAWFQRLAENKEQAIKLVGIKNYNRCLCYFTAAWRLLNDRNLLPTRIVLEHRNEKLNEGKFYK